MIQRAIIICLIAFSAILISCRVRRPAISPAAVNITANAEEYIRAYKDLAISEMRRTGVPASITLAQGMVESDYGRSTLARTANNHFGIKCHDDWSGPSVRHHDERRNECFRKYRRVEDSFYDHSDFLRTRSRYHFLFDIDPADYRAWAHGLKKAGYATNPHYASMLIRKIEENNLHIFDNIYTTSVPDSGRNETFKKEDTYLTETAADTGISSQPDNEAISFGAVMARVSRIMENNRVQYIIVKDGESKEDIAEEFKLLKRELALFNDLDDSFTPVPGQILYIQPKKDKAEEGKEFHYFEEGETIHIISQKYGIKLKSLLEMNGLNNGTEPVPGQKIWLRGKMPVNSQ